MQAEQFSYCQPWMLAWGYRKQNLIAELVSYNADIMCLQVCCNHLPLHPPQDWVYRLAHHDCLEQQWRCCNPAGALGALFICSVLTPTYTLSNNLSMHSKGRSH